MLVDDILFVCLLLLSLSWFVLFVARFKKGLLPHHLLCLGITSALAVGLFYGIQLEQAPRLQSPRSIPINAQILLLATKVVAALWAVAWAVSRKYGPTSMLTLHRTGAALNIAIMAGFVWDFFAGHPQ